MCGCALSVMLLTLAVVLPTPHDYSGTFQGGFSARFTCTLQKQSVAVLSLLSKVHPCSAEWCQRGVLHFLLLKGRLDHIIAIHTYICVYVHVCGVYMSVVCTCLWCVRACGVYMSVVCCLMVGCVWSVFFVCPPLTPTVVLSQLSTTRNKVQRRKKVAAERGKTLTYKCTHMCTNACDSRTWVCTHTHGHTIAHILPKHVPGATLHHMPLRATSNDALVVRSEMIPSTSPLLIQVCWPPLSRRR